MVVVHIFSNVHGQDMMHAIFGMVDEEMDELFNPRNGMLLDRTTGKAFDIGQLKFVPMAKNKKSKAKIGEYKICILGSHLLVQ